MIDRSFIHSILNAITTVEMLVHGDLYKTSLAFPKSSVAKTQEPPNPKGRRFIWSSSDLELIWEQHRTTKSLQHWKVEYWTNNPIKLRTSKQTNWPTLSPPLGSLFLCQPARSLKNTWRATLNSATVFFSKNKVTNYNDNSLHHLQIMLRMRNHGCFRHLFACLPQGTPPCMLQGNDKSDTSSQLFCPRRPNRPNSFRRKCVHRVAPELEQFTNFTKIFAWRICFQKDL